MGNTIGTYTNKFTYFYMQPHRCALRKISTAHTLASPSLLQSELFKPLFNTYMYCKVHNKQLPMQQNWRRVLDL